MPPKPHSNDIKPIETSFPIRQYVKALGELRRYISDGSGLDINLVLLCALIHISIEVIQNNYLNALVHLENSLHLLQTATTKGSVPAQSDTATIFNNGSVDTDIEQEFLRLDLHASTFQGMRPPAMAHNQAHATIPGRFSSLREAKYVLDQLIGQLYFFSKTTVEEYKFRKQQDMPLDAVAEAERLKNEFLVWNDRFSKYLQRSTSKFSRQEQVIIDILLISHMINFIEASTCIQPEAIIFDQFDTEFDEVVTLAANVLRSRKEHQPNVFEFSLDIGIIHPLYCTAIRCREPWIRRRAMTLLRSITFQEGVWNASAQASRAQVAINREMVFDEPGASNERPKEFVRVHSVGSEAFDPVKRVAEVTLSQKLNGLDGPWHGHVEWCSW